MDTFHALMRMALDHQREVRRTAELYGRTHASRASSLGTLAGALKRLVGSLGRLLIVMGRRLEDFSRTARSTPSTQFQVKGRW